MCQALSEVCSDLSVHLSAAGGDGRMLPQSELEAQVHCSGTNSRLLYFCQPRLCLEVQVKTSSSNL